MLSIHPKISIILTSFKIEMLSARERGAVAGTKIDADAPGPGLGLDLDLDLHLTSDIGEKSLLVEITIEAAKGNDPEALEEKSTEILETGTN